ncbi:MAG: hypothetical protein MHM6MM_001472 [Cercozoa sp. M6MM]
MQEGTNDGEYLCLVLDVSAVAWLELQQKEKKNCALAFEQIHTFLNAFLLFNEANRLSIVLGNGQVAFDDDSDGGDQVACDVESSELAFLRGSAVLRDVLASAFKQSEKSDLNLGASMSLALCRLARVSRETPRLSRRLCVLCVTPDQDTQYVSVMNGIFAAQKESVPVDSLCIGTSSDLLQQAAALTEGVTTQIDGMGTMLHTLLSVFVSPGSLRSQLHVPKPTSVDFRARCFCHRKQVDMALVCPVCLSVFCTRQKKCPTCGSVLQRR